MGMWIGALNENAMQFQLRDADGTHLHSQRHTLMHLIITADTCATLTGGSTELTGTVS